MIVRLEREGAIARIVMDRPERYNALTDEMKNELLECLQTIRYDHSVRAVLLIGEGKAFCSGSDVGTMGEFDPLAGRDRIQHAHDFILALANLEKPVIAAVRGHAVGVGWSLAMACDIILASDTARFAQVFKKIGLAPDGVTQPSLESFLELESHVQNLVLQSPDRDEGIAAFMEKRPPEFIGR